VNLDIRICNKMLVWAADLHSHSIMNNNWKPCSGSTISTLILWARDTHLQPIGHVLPLSDYFVNSQATIRLRLLQLCIHLSVARELG